MHEPDEQREIETAVRLEARADELSALSTHLIRTAEIERSTLAKQLHDELGGLITAAKMDMSWLSTRLGTSLDPESRDKLNSVMQMLNQAMILKRRVVENLRPSLLDHFGLAVAMRSHFEEQCASAGIECVATLPDATLEIDPIAQLTLFRVAQETLTGILARGGAKHVELVIESEGDGYVMLIGDDAAPMNSNLMQSMPSVRHRMLGVGGSVEAETHPEYGNRIRAYVPRAAARSA